MDNTLERIRRLRELSLPWTSKTCMNLSAKEQTELESLTLTMKCGLLSMEDMERTSATLVTKQLISDVSRTQSVSMGKSWRDRCLGTSVLALTWTMNVMWAIPELMKADASLKTMRNRPR
jgi:hypothetical protein